MKITKRQLERAVRKVVFESFQNEGSSEASDLFRSLGPQETHLIKNWVKDGSTDIYDLPDKVAHFLLDYFRNEMPVGIQKAREGDPGVWLADRLEGMLGHDPMGEAGVSGGGGEGMDLGKRQTNLPQAPGAVPRQPGGGKIAALNRTVMPSKNEELDLDTGAVLDEVFNEGAGDRFDKLNQLQEIMSDEEILIELVKMMPDHEWAEHHKTLMQYFSGDPDYGVNSENAHDLDTSAILEDAMNEGLSRSSFVNNLDNLLQKLTHGLEEYSKAAVKIYYNEDDEDDTFGIRDVKRMINALARKLKEDVDSEVSIDVKNMTSEKNNKYILFSATIPERPYDDSDEDTYGLFGDK